MACRLGMLKAMSDPFNTPRTIRCQNSTTSVISRVATRSAKMALPAWLNITIRFREILSARAPPINDTNVIGAAKETMTRDSDRGESSASLSTSQPLVIICMFSAMNEANEPSHIHRKSRYCRESKIE